MPKNELKLFQSENEIFAGECGLLRAIVFGNMARKGLMSSGHALDATIVKITTNW